MDNIKNSEELFEILGIEKLDLDYLKNACYSMIEETSMLSNNLKDKKDVDSQQFDAFTRSIKKSTDINEVLYHYIFLKWLWSTKKLKVEQTPEAKKQSELFLKISRNLDSAEKVAEYMSESEKSLESEQESPNQESDLSSDEFEFYEMKKVKKSETKLEPIDISSLLEPDIPEWDLSRYAYQGDDLDYNVRFKVKIYPKTKLILNSRKNRVSVFLVGKFAVGREDEIPNHKVKAYKMLTVVNKDDVYMIVGKFDEDDIRENPNFYIRNMFNRWSLKNADRNNFGYPGNVVMDENGNRKVAFDIPGSQDLVQALSIARKQYPEIFGSFNKKTRNKKKIKPQVAHDAPGEDDGGR